MTENHFYPGKSWKMELKVLQCHSLTLILCKVHQSVKSLEWQIFFCVQTDSLAQFVSFVYPYLSVEAGET